jgi:hypothetical protein
VPANEVEEEIERPLEGLEEYRKRLGRNVEIRRHLGHRLAADARDRQREVEDRLLVGHHGRVVGGVRRHFLP